MQHTQDTIDKFIELRAQNISFTRIAQHLNVARSTTLKWAKLHKTKIDNFRAMELEAAQEQFLGSYQERLKIAVARLRRYEQEMDSRQAKYMDMKELQMLINDSRKEVEKLMIVPTFTDEPEQAADPVPPAAA